MPQYALQQPQAYSAPQNPYGRSQFTPLMPEYEAAQQPMNPYELGQYMPLMPEYEMSEPEYEEPEEMMYQMGYPSPHMMMDPRMPYAQPEPQQPIE